MITEDHRYKYGLRKDLRFTIYDLGNELHEFPVRMDTDKQGYRELAELVLSPIVNRKS
jgi:hypothetical protein